MRWLAIAVTVAATAAAVMALLLNAGDRHDPVGRLSPVGVQLPAPAHATPRHERTDD